jgi:acyl carrier protein
MSHLEVVRDFVVKNFLFGDGAKLEDDSSFLESGIIDSTGILELITFLEENYGIQIDDEELVPDNMDSLQNVARFLARKLDGSVAAENKEN